MLVITHAPSPKIAEGERTFLDRRPIDIELVCAQHREFCSLLARLGARVVCTDVNRHLADSVFVEDTAVILDEIAVMASMGAVSRRAEVEGIEPLLKQWRRTVRVALPATLEGGDVLRADRTLWIGHSCRTNAEGMRVFQELVSPFGYQVRTVAVRGCLHLKTACTVLPDGRFLVQPAWIDVSQLPRGWITVSDEEPWAANVLVFHDWVVVPSAHRRTAEMLSREGYSVQTVDISEIAKAEGGVTCLALLVSDREGSQ